jgi:hypothetical protein
MHIGEAFTRQGRSILLKLQFAAFQGWTRVRTRWQTMPVMLDTLKSSICFDLLAFISIKQHYKATLPRKDRRGR